MNQVLESRLRTVYKNYFADSSWAGLSRPTQNFISTRCPLPCKGAFVLCHRLLGACSPFLRPSSELELDTGRCKTGCCWRPNNAGCRPRPSPAPTVECVRGFP